MNKHQKTVWMTATAFIAAGLMAVPPAIRAADVPDSEQVSKLLSETKTMAFQLKEDAETMESYARSSVAWRVTLPRLPKSRNTSTPLVARP
jgi:hypothetical protein